MADAHLLLLVAHLLPILRVWLGATLVASVKKALDGVLVSGISTVHIVDLVLVHVVLSILVGSSPTSLDRSEAS